MRKVDMPEWGAACEWQGLEEFLSAEVVPNGVHRICMSTADGAQASLDMFVHLIPGTSIAVHFYGAQKRPRRNSAPTFGALPTLRSLNTSFVSVHDPTLSLSTDIGIGWYEGFRGFAAAPIIDRALSHLARNSGAPRTVLWGGSAGGYAALRHVGSVPDAVALVWNPQTAILRYQKDPVRRYSRIAFGTDDLTHGAADTPGVTIDLVDMPEPVWEAAPVVYLQEADDRHVHRHLAHLLRHRFPEAAAEVCRRDTMFGLLDPNFYLHQSLWEPGHARPPKPAVNEFLSRLLDTRRPVREILAGLEPASRELIRASREAHRAPVEFELDAPIRQSPEKTRVLQWGSRFGREATAHASKQRPMLVSRSILGQSLVTAFSIRKNPAPKTALDLPSAHNSEQRQTLLRDRRASASASIHDDPNIDCLVLDLIEEVRGTVNAGNGFIVTNHGFLRRVDGTELIEAAFGSERHMKLWSSRLDRLQTALEESGTEIVVLDVDAAKLRSEDWTWLGVPQPPAEVLGHWAECIGEARNRLRNAIWVPIEIRDRPLSDHTADAGSRLAEALVDRNEQSSRDRS